MDQVINKIAGNHDKQDSHKETEKKMKSEDTKSIGDQMNLNLSQGEQKAKESSPILPSITSVPEVDEEWGNQL